MSQHGTFGGAGYSVLDTREGADRFCAFARELVERYKNDERVLMWDVFNEPGNSNRKSLSLPVLRRLFALIRGIDPIQPLTVGVWSETKHPEIERFGLEHSDIVSFHCYSSYADNVEILHRLKAYGRPIVNTEWLARCIGNTVEEIFPLFFAMGVGCYNWGFVAGKYQTYEPWEGMWDNYAKDPAHNGWDFDKWFHDLYRPSLHPYNPNEIALIKRFCALADEKH